MASVFVPGSWPPKKYRENLEEGEHMYKWKKLGIYAHHGIYVGSGMVIDFEAHKRSPMRLLKSGSSSEFCNDCYKYGMKTDYGVRKVCLDCFLKDPNEQEINCYQYGVREEDLKHYKRGGTCSRLQEDKNRSAVVARANYFLENGFGKYNFFEHNCEAFAVYCKTGKKFSGQAHGLTAFLVRASTLNIVKPNWHSFNDEEFTGKVEVDLIKYFKEKA